MTPWPLRPPRRPSPPAPPRGAGDSREKAARVGPTRLSEPPALERFLRVIEDGLIPQRLDEGLDFSLGRLVAQLVLDLFLQLLVERHRPGVLPLDDADDVIAALHLHDG